MTRQTHETICEPLSGRTTSPDPEDVHVLLATGDLQDVRIPLLGEPATLRGLGGAPERRRIDGIDHDLFAADVTVRTLGSYAKTLRRTIERTNSLLVVRINRHLCIAFEIEVREPGYVSIMDYYPIARGDDGVLYCGYEELDTNPFYVRVGGDVSLLCERVRLVTAKMGFLRRFLLEDDAIDALVVDPLEDATIAERLGGAVRAFAMLDPLGVSLEISIGVSFPDRRFNVFIDSDRRGGFVGPALSQLHTALVLFVEHALPENLWTTKRLFPAGFVHLTRFGSLRIAAQPARADLFEIALDVPSALDKAAALADAKRIIATIARTDPARAAHIATLVLPDADHAHHERDLTEKASPTSLS